MSADEPNEFDATDPEGVPMTEWRSELSSALRTPTFKMSYWEALSRRLRKVYFPLYVLLGVAWAFRISLYTPGESWVATASVPGLAGEVVLSVVAVFFLLLTVFAFWPRQRRARGEFHGEESGDGKR